MQLESIPKSDQTTGSHSTTESSNKSETPSTAGLFDKNRLISEPNATKERFRINSSNATEERVLLANGKLLVSCLKGSKLTNKEERQDRQGNAIDAQKRFKLTYVDKVNKGEPLAQIHLVESYK